MNLHLSPKILLQLTCKCLPLIVDHYITAIVYDDTPLRWETQVSVIQDKGATIQCYIHIHSSAIQLGVHLFTFTEKRVENKYLSMYATIFRWFDIK